MCELPQHVIHKLRSSNLADSTIWAYTNFLKNYMKHGWDEDYIFNIDLIKFYLDTISPTSREGFLLAVVHAFDACCENNRSTLRQMVRNAKDESMILSIRRLSHAKTEKVTFEEMQIMAQRKQKNKINDLIVQLYTLEVPLRADTWSRVRIIDVEEPNTCEQYNYLSLDTGLLYLNRYKTFKTYGKRTLLLNDDLLKYIKTWWHNNHMYIGNVFKFLVPSRDGNRLSAHNFNLRLTTIFGFGSRVLRHSYVSYKRRTNTTDEEMQKIACRMNTSYLQANITYDDTNNVYNDSDSE